MNIELAVIAYTIICTTLVIASAFMIPSRALNQRRLEKQTQAFQWSIENLLSKQHMGQEVTPDELASCVNEKAILSLGGLMAFLGAIENLKERYGSKEVSNFCRNLIPLFSGLCKKHMDSRPLIKTYFIHTLGVVFEDVGMVSEEIQEFLLISLRTKSIYCRQNALATAYKFGDVGFVVRTINIFNRTFDDYSQRLISDGLVEFRGDKRQLASLLLQYYDQYNTYLKLAVLNFIRYTQDGHNEFMLDVLCDHNADPDLQIAAIRYFGKYKDERARPILEGMLAELVDIPTPECSAVCATALSNYPGARSFAILKKSLSSSDWYVRLNASISLEQMGFDYHQMSDILSGNDRYAREIVYYRLQQQKLRQKQEAV